MKGNLSQSQVCFQDVQLVGKCIGKKRNINDYFLLNAPGELITFILIKDDKWHQLTGNKN